MKRLKAMKENLMCCVEAEIAGNLRCVDTEELGKAVDMIKDISEAMYYCSITEAMEKSKKEEAYKQTHHQNENGQMYAMDKRYPDYYRDVDRERGKMYYDGHPMMQWDENEEMHYLDEMFPMRERDHREGRSPMSRKAYLESKERHTDKTKHMKELEHYIQELSEDIVEMIHEASPEEKQLLQQKISGLAAKIK